MIDDDLVNLNLLTVSSLSCVARLYHDSKSVGFFPDLAHFFLLRLQSGPLACPRLPCRRTWPFLA